MDSVGQKVGQKMDKSRKFTIKELEALTVADHNLTIRESGGLCGRVRAGKLGITVLFRFEFKLNGKKHDHRLGSWPKKSLADIRSERDKVKVKVSQGINPTRAKKAAKIEARNSIEAIIQKEKQERINNLTVTDLFNTWITDGVNRADGNKELRRLFEKDVLTTIGNISLSQLTDRDILSMLRKQMKRGVVRLTLVTLSDVRQMLTWGEKRQPWRGLLINGNPADLVNEQQITPADYEESRNRTLSPTEIRELQVIFQSMDEAYYQATDKRATSRPVTVKTQLALWICLGTACRIGELLQARWEHVDLDARTWFIPRSNAKAKLQDQMIFLSDFTLSKFIVLKTITGDTEWLFPAKNKIGKTGHVCPKSISKQVGDRQIKFKNRSKPLIGRTNDDSLVLSEGKNGEWTPHDLRRTAATMMQELGIPLDIIDRCQNHVLAGSKVRRHYLKHDYAKEKAEAWNQLGNRLMAILAGGAEIVPLQNVS